MAELSHSVLAHSWARKSEVAISALVQDGVFE